MTTKPVLDLAKGDAILFPVWEGPTCSDQPRTISAVIEYPETRVLYFQEGGYGIADKHVDVTLADRCSACGSPAPHHVAYVREHGVCVS